MGNQNTVKKAALKAYSQLLGSLSSRLGWYGNLGNQYDGDRNLYEALGYKTSIKYSDFWSQFTRQDIAQAIIMRPVSTTWNGELVVAEMDKSEETPFEKEYKDLEKRLKLRMRFRQVDKLTGIGRYGVLLLGFNDTVNKEAFAASVKKSNSLKLLYVKPVSEENATVYKYEEDTTSERYGLPLTYQVNLSSPDGNNTYSLVVHYTRVIHIVDEPTGNESIGTPRLEVVFNRLMDLEKMVGGSAEMFWRGARPGMQAKVDPNFTMTPADEDDLQTQIDEYEHNLRRIFKAEGVTLESLLSQVSDPKNHVDVQIMMISAVTNIPKRILTGSERGELSSGQDSDEWSSFIQSRRINFAEPAIVRAFIDRCIEYKILPQPSGDYTVLWEDLFAKSEKDKVEIGVRRATAIKEYTTNPVAESVMPPDAFYELCLGLSEEQIDFIKKTMESSGVREQRELDLEETIEQNNQ